MRFEAEPWKEIMGRDCKPCGAVVGGAAPLSTGTGALLALVVIAYVVFELDKKVPR